MRRWFSGSLAFAALATAHAQTDYTHAVEQVGPSVVHIVVQRPVPPPKERGGKSPDDDTARFLERFATQPTRPAPARASGFILSADGYVVTAASNLEGSEILIKITLSDGREFPAKRVAVDERTDIGLLKIETTGLRPVKFGDPSKLKVGQRLLLVGSAFAGINTVADGIVSQPLWSAHPGSRPDGVIAMPYLATTVPVQRGNGGAPFVDASGEVVGLVTQMYVTPGNPFATISFGVLPDVIRSVTESLRTLGYVRRGAIRVTIQEVNKEIADSLGMPAPRGALVAAVQRGGPADRAGIAAGDIILQFNGRAVESTIDIPRIVNDTPPGTRASVRIMRKGGPVSLEVEVEEDRRPSLDPPRPR